MNKLLIQLKRHEGFRATAYHCTEGKLTIGYGYNLDANPLGLSKNDVVGLKNLGISEKRAEDLLIDHVRQIRHNLEGDINWWSKLNDARQDALINMAFNLGIDGLFKFKRTLGLIKYANYDDAAIEMLESKWAGQVKGRALELAEQLRTGRYTIA